MPVKCRGPLTRIALSGVMLAALGLGASACAGGEDRTSITVAAVDFMRDMEKLIDDFEQDHPHTHVNLVFLPENELRRRTPKDIATEARRYDVIAIGPYEAPIWASRGWLTPLDTPARQSDEDMRDFVPMVRSALSYKGHLFAVPYYGESSFLMYRKDLLAKAGLTMPQHPTWQQVAQLAAKLHDPENGIAGICLRGGPGWKNLLPLNTVIAAFGGRWYDEHWNPQLTSPATKRAVEFYVNLVRRYGEPHAAESGPAECLAVMREGRAALWYDATSHAGRLEDPASSNVAGKIGYAPAPVVRTKSSGWLWTWALAIPVTAKNPRAAWEFASWATSKQYPELYGERLGWVRLPPGARLSTYRLPQYQKAARTFIKPTLDAFKAVNLTHPEVLKQPWSGVSYIVIPEFAGLGDRVSEEISAAIADRQPLDAALANAQLFAEDVVEGGGYRSPSP